MKNYIISFCLIFGVYASAEDISALENAFKNGTINGKLRTFWFDGQRDLKTNRTSLSIGGILSYKTQSSYNFEGMVSFFTSHGISALTDMPESGGTNNLQSDGKPIDVLGEALLSYRLDNTLFSYGRKRMDTPLLNDYYNRMLPNSYEGFFIQNNSFEKTKIDLAYVTRWKYKDSQKFTSPTSAYGFERDIAMLGIDLHKWNMHNIIYDYYIKDVMNALYIQSEVDGPLNAKFQYLREDGTGKSLLGLKDTYMLGINLGLKYERWRLNAVVTQIGEQTLLGTGNNYSKMGWSSFITFTDIQIDGESENAGALAFGAILTKEFMQGFTSSIKYIHIDQNDAKQNNIHSLTSNPRPDSDEYNFDASYKKIKNLKLRTRFAYIDYNPNSTKLYKDKAYNEFNTRIILDYNF